MFVYRANSTSEPRPIRLVMNGVDFIFDSHPDIYILDYNAYTPNWNEERAYIPPGSCNQKHSFPATHGKRF